MSNEELFGASCEDRYDYFLAEVTAQREIWILVNSDMQFLKIFDEDDASEYLPVWPSEMHASQYGDGATDLTPKSIAIPEFFAKWVKGLTRDGLLVGVFPGADSTVWITTPAELQTDLAEQLSSSL